MTLEEFNALPEAEARSRLAACLDVPRWVDTVVAARPFPDLGALRSVAEVAASSMSEAELEQALARHPRIGERAGAGHDAAASAREQSGVDAGDRAVAERLTAGNRAYEQRFDRVFLIRAAGRDADEILAELDRRLDNDDDTERRETIGQLAEIALLRLEEVVGPWPR
ncbi:2-oxo-4-hydroxy-4-carboxy-5-ureidoimidazoline decarboxylase [Nocardioides coralli]|uniref:2-oxo-4-hydroxy-4-carboxy-5-ureidoimidazoline decarboxylase n=1 Tax=Nocardioides coralli TaxID=2872154 RepID=UPI001CA390F4|nr:2-oxo-4-hydroxy-4-carboxy-5-ureidoimidazoline decarboxylase [Nocardioides coralli]QZY29854.1 2-oxo-4-hydroxy-4-carboxy-5-ureidoimidazoline decarboxylase [Nocardioides coralli]